MYLEKEMECAICLFHRDDQQVLHCSISTQFGGDWGAYVLDGRGNVQLFLTL
jgi:hypothetical protein